ncbi:MAG: hypothetical protein MRY83_06455 [Flavobacteriales bacterium]|nr:hypothetical protein [Flavobacteriales bacterium]
MTSDASNLQHFQIQCRLGIKSSEIVTPSEAIEVSLPCVNCKRNRRTVIFDNSSKFGICTPRDKCPGFKGKLSSYGISREPNFAVLTYNIAFEYESFIDQKYKNESYFSRWARVYFTLQCSKCKQKNTLSTQDNMVRPFTEKCRCGNAIYLENENPLKYFLNSEQLLRP